MWRTLDKHVLGFRRLAVCSRMHTPHSQPSATTAQTPTNPTFSSPYRQWNCAAGVPQHYTQQRVRGASAGSAARLAPAPPHCGTANTPREEGGEGGRLGSGSGSLGGA